MTSRSRVSTCLAAMAAAALLGACGQNAGATASSGSPSPTAGTCTPTAAPFATAPDEYSDGDRRIALMRAEQYDTIEQLDADASLVVVATAGESRRSVVLPASGTEFDTDMTVSCVLRGDYDGDRLVVTTTGGPGVVVSDHPPSIKPGAQYLIWLRPTTGDQASDSRFGIVGYAGRYAVSGDVAVRLDPMSPSLPPKISISEYQRG